MTIIKDNTVLRDSLAPEDVIEQTLIHMIADGFKAETIVLKGELPKR